MLTISQQAAETIREIVEDSDVGPAGGLRISSGGEEELDFDVVGEPDGGDETVRSGGATVFLDAAAAAMLSDKQLDVHAHGDHFHFSIDEQPAG